MLSQCVDHYLAVRRTAGFKLHNPQRYLHAFVSFANARGDTHVRVESAIAWAALARTETERARRLQVLRLFSRFMHAEEPRHELLPEHVFCGHHRGPTAYILTDEELQRLLEQARRLGPPGSLTAHTYSTLITLLVRNRPEADRSAGVALWGSDPGRASYSRNQVSPLARACPTDMGT